LSALRAIERGDVDDMVITRPTMGRITALLVTLGVLTLGPASAQAAPVTFSYTGPAVAIPDDDPAGTSVPIAVAGLDPVIGDVNFSIDGTACSAVMNATTVGITHSWVGDLVITLTSPAGTPVTVISHAGGTGNSSNNFCQVVLDDDAPGAASIQAVTTAQAPFTGTWTPANPLSAFDGQNPNGAWTVAAQDTALLDTGSLRALSLTIDATTFVATPAAGQWRMGDAAPSTVMTDSSGNANNGTYLNGVTLGQPGVIAGNTAALFDGVNDTARVPDSATLDVGDSFSVEGWVKRSSTTKATELFNKGANGLQLTVMNAGSGNQVWLRKAGVTTIAHSTVGVPADGAFHHVVATKNGPGSTLIYIDGVEAGTVQVGGGVQAIQDTTFPLTFAGAGSTPTVFDEFALYDGVLTPAEVAAHHTAGSPPPPPPPTT
jgi:subtilisin-like proprotein convertase family protein